MQPIKKDLLLIFSKSRFPYVWIANQESIDTYVYFMKETDSLIYVNNGKSVYIFDQWLDEDILPLLDKQIQNKNFGRRNLFILHTIGSHCGITYIIHANMPVGNQNLKAEYYLPTPKKSSLTPMTIPYSIPTSFGMK